MASTPAPGSRSNTSSGTDGTGLRSAAHGDPTTGPDQIGAAHSRPRPGSGDPEAQQGLVPEGRAQAPIRWPRPDRPTVVYTGMWVLGLLVALIVPAIIVPPNERNPPAGQIWLAFAFTAVGAVIMILAASRLWRSQREPVVMVMAAVPAFAVIVGGLILAFTKLFDSRGFGGS
jgi:hypothetical protein